MCIVKACVSSAVALVLCSCTVTQEPAGKQNTTDSVVFYAMGDVPYTQMEEQSLQRHIAELPSDGRFVIHVGDIKAGQTPCDESIYANVSNMLAASKSPLFIIPGDNEWNDCANAAQGWAFWQKYFRRFDDQWHHRLPLFRQLEREENFSFIEREVLFVGINLVGGRVHDADEWKLRHQQNLEWIRRNVQQAEGLVYAAVVFGHATPTANHDDFFAPFSGVMQEFGKPVLYLHGDGHRWKQDYPFTARNVLRVQVDQGGIAPPVKVTVRKHATKTFVFDRRK